MTLTEARKFCDLVRVRKVKCIVPLGHGPDKYFVRVLPNWDYPVFELDSADMAQAFVDEDIRQESLNVERTRQALRQLGPRSPLALMIDRACGLA